MPPRAPAPAAQPSPPHRAGIPARASPRSLARSWPRSVRPSPPARPARCPALRLSPPRLAQSLALSRAGCAPRLPRPPARPSALPRSLAPSLSFPPKRWPTPAPAPGSLSPCPAPHPGVPFACPPALVGDDSPRLPSSSPPPSPQPPRSSGGGGRIPPS